MYIADARGNRNYILYSFSSNKGGEINRLVND